MVLKSVILSADNGLMYKYHPYYTNRMHYNWDAIFYDALRHNVTLKCGRDIRTLNPQSWVANSVRPAAQRRDYEVVSLTHGMYVMIRLYDWRDTKPKLSKDQLLTFIERDLEGR